MNQKVTPSEALMPLGQPGQGIGAAHRQEGALVQGAVAAGGFHPGALDGAVPVDAEVDLHPALGRGQAVPVAGDAALDLQRGTRMKGKLPSRSAISPLPPSMPDDGLESGHGGARSPMPPPAPWPAAPMAGLGEGALPLAATGALPRLSWSGLVPLSGLGGLGAEGVGGHLGPAGSWRWGATSSTRRWRSPCLPSSMGP